MDSHPSPRSSVRSKYWTVERLGFLGLCIALAVVTILTTLGPAAKSGFWMRTQLLVLVAATGFALWLAIVAAARGVRRRAASTSFPPLLISAGLAFVAWGILYPAYRSAHEEIAAVNEIVGFTHAILSYANEHDGWLPKGLADLIEEGYIQRSAAGGWQVSRGPDQASSALRDPAWFDVAWGVHKRDVAANGMVERQQRAVLRPAPSGPPPSFESVCGTISRSIGQHLSDGAP